MRFAEINHERGRYKKLLLLGDEDWKMVKRYLDQGRMLVGFKQGKPVGLVLAAEIEPQTWELKNIAVLPHFQHQGCGTALLKELEKGLKNDCSWLLVGTGDADTDNIHFYLKNGFRMQTIRKHFFDQYDHPIISHGIQLQDMVVLAKRLN